MFCTKMVDMSVGDMISQGVFGFYNGRWGDNDVWSGETGGRICQVEGFGDTAL